MDHTIHRGQKKLICLSKSELGNYVVIQFRLLK